MTEQIDDGRDGPVVLGCHQGMAVKLTGDLPKGYKKMACKFHCHHRVATLDDKAIPAIIDLFRLRRIIMDSLK